MASHRVGLPQAKPIPLSECVALCPPSPAAVVTPWFVTGFRIPVALGRSTAPSPGSHLVLTEARVTRPVFDELTG